MNIIFLPIQILLILFLVFAFTRVILRFKEASITPGTFLFWSAIWILALVGVVEPEFTTWVANKIGIGRGVDAIIYISLVILFYLVYRTNVHLENVRHEITELTRKAAFKELEKSNKKVESLNRKIT
jgi:hypothetical protein